MARVLRETDDGSIVHDYIHVEDFNVLNGTLLGWYYYSEQEAKEFLKVRNPENLSFIDALCPEQSNRSKNSRKIQLFATNHRCTGIPIEAVDDIINCVPFYEYKNVVHCQNFV